MLFCVSVVTAQDYSTVLTLGDSPLANVINPAYIPKSSYLNLPIPVLGNISVNVNNPFALNTIVQDNVVQLDQIDKNAQTNIGLGLDILNLGIRKNKGLFTFSVSTNIEADVMYPTGIFDFIQNNPLDRTKPFEIDYQNLINAWAEVAFGYSRIINDNWTVGVKVKYLQGGITVNTNQTDILIEKNFDSYLISGDIDIMVGGYDVEEEEFDTDNIMNNRGFAGDIGVHYTSDDNKWFAGFAITDIGYIKYASATHIVSKNPNEKYFYEGVVDENGDPINLGGADFDLGDLLADSFDDMIDHLDVDKNPVKNVKVWIPTTVHLGGGYNLDDNGRHLVTGNFLGQVHSYTLTDYSVTAGYTYHSKLKNFRLMASATHCKHYPFSVGAGFLVGGDRFHIYAMADSNVQGVWDYANIESFGFRMGAIFWMGAKRK